MLSSIPFHVIASGATSLFLPKMAARRPSAYAKATAVVGQTIGSFRTVASFTGEKQAVTKYNKFLVNSYESGVFEGLAAGFRPWSSDVHHFCKLCIGSLVWCKDDTGKMIY